MKLLGVKNKFSSPQYRQTVSNKEGLRPELATKSREGSHAKEFWPRMFLARSMRLFILAGVKELDDFLF